MTGKPHRDPSVIANEIHSIGRSRIFEIGARLIEAQDFLQHGKWMAWFRAAQFDFEIQSARNYMAAALLQSKNPKFGYLNVPKAILYQLAASRDKNLSDIIDALHAASQDKRLSQAEADAIIETVSGPAKPDSWIPPIIEAVAKRAAPPAETAPNDASPLAPPMPRNEPALVFPKPRAKMMADLQAMLEADYKD
jgi:hypothetical protein